MNKGIITRATIFATVAIAGISCTDDIAGPDTSGAQRVVIDPGIASVVVPSVFVKGQTVHVAGTFEERFFQFNLTAPHGVVATAFDTFTGDLAGTGLLHIHSSEFISFDTELNVVSTRTIFTSQGNLFLSEVGERNGDDVAVLSTVTGGTGVFKRASGQLSLDGTHGATFVSFTYTGSITLAP
jgi:hypothetical protein